VDFVQLKVQLFLCSGTEKVTVWWQVRGHTAAYTGYQAGHRHTKPSDWSTAGGWLL